MTHENTLKGKIVARPYTAKDEVAERLTDMGKSRQDIQDNDTANNNNNDKETKRSRLLANPNIKRWHDNLARGSKLTADGRLRRLGRFCEMHDITPMQLADLAMKDLRITTDLVEDHITMMESQGFAPGYIQDQLKTVKSWLRHFDVDIKRKLKVSSATTTPTLADERVPDGAEMSEIYSRAGLRESAIISLMAKAGLRPEVIGNHDGTDGLQIRDLPDVVIHQGVAKCIRMPNRIVVRAELSKARHQYFTFTTRTATMHILAYLNDRITHGEPLAPDSAVIAPDHTYKTNRGRNSTKRFLPTPRVSKLVRDTFRPRFSWRPYVLRAYFDTQLLIAESRGKIAHDFRVFFMGHRGSIEARYTTNKMILPEALTTEMRDSFERAEEFIDQAPDSVNAEDIIQQRHTARTMIEQATPEQLGRMLEALTRVPAI